MTGLAWANIKFRKLRSALAALAVAIGIAMLVTMLGLSHGTLEEVAQRVKGIDAELIVMPSETSAIFSEGAPLPDKYIDKIISARVDNIRVVRDVIPVYFVVMPKMAGQQQRVFAINPSQFKAFAKGLVEGKLFEKNQCQLVIDQRLARAGNYKLGDKIFFIGKEFEICGIIGSGAAGGRVFAPIDVVREITMGGMARSSLFFVKLDPNKVDVNEKETAGNMIRVGQCADAITNACHLKVASLNQYDKLLFNSFGPIYVYINVASGIVLTVSFLFIMVTIYTMVLERRREIGILRSMGAGGFYIMSQTISEALIISVSGMVAGLGLAFLAKIFIEHFRPLLTVDLQTEWLLLGVAVGFIGGLVSAIYPGYCAIRQDPLAALGYE